MRRFWLRSTPSNLGTDNQLQCNDMKLMKNKNATCVQLQFVCVPLKKEKTRTNWKRAKDAFASFSFKNKKFTLTQQCQPEVNSEQL